MGISSRRVAYRRGGHGQAQGPRTGTGACPYGFDSKRGRKNSSSLAFAPQLPAFAVRPEDRRCGNVRAARESNPPYPPLTGGYKSDAVREGDWGLNSHAPARGGAFMDPRAAEKMKIMAFPVNSDKFTGFLDKFPKTDERGAREAIGMISDGYGDIIKKVVNILSKCTGLKSFFRPPHFPATARICPHRIMPANPPAPGERSIPPSLVGIDLRYAASPLLRMRRRGLLQQPLPGRV